MPTPDVPAPTPQELADLLRDCEFAMSKASTALLLFTPRDQTKQVERDFDRLNEACRKVKAALVHLPPPVPLTPEQEAAVGRVLGAVMEKRFGSGEDRVREAIEAWKDVPRAR